jgi:hypothetical protein
VNEPQPVPRADPIRVFAPWVGVCAAADLFGPPVMIGLRSEVSFACLTGAVGGQLGVLTVWAVFGPERLLQRWTKALFAALFLYGVLLVGFIISERGWGSRAEALSTLLMLPAVFLAAQAPLWILRMATGWEIVARGEQASPPAASRQFGLQHLLGATTAVAAMLALAKMGFFALGARENSQVAEGWLGLAIACVAAGLWNGLLTIPCLYATMVAKERGAGCAAVAVYQVVLCIVIVAVMSLIFGSRPPPEAFMTFLGFNATIAVVVSCSLILLGKSGYVLRRPRAAGTVEAAAVAADGSGEVQHASDAPEAGNPFRTE